MRRKKKLMRQIEDETTKTVSCKQPNSLDE